MEVLVLSKKPPYDMKAEDGRQITGFKLVYAPLDVKVSTEGFVGLLVLDKSFPTEFYDKFPIVPGVYELEIQDAFTASGRRVEIPLDTLFIRQPQLSDFGLLLLEGDSNE